MFLSQFDDVSVGDQIWYVCAPAAWASCATTSAIVVRSGRRAVR